MLALHRFTQANRFQFESIFHGDPQRKIMIPHVVERMSFKQEGEKNELLVMSWVVTLHSLTHSKNPNSDFVVLFVANDN